MAKISKKATTKIIDLVQSINPKVSKNTSFDEAWHIIAEYINIEYSIYTSIKLGTKFTIHVKDKNIDILTWSNNDVFTEDGDWDWTTIYKDAIEYIISHKMVKKPRKKRLVK